MSEPSLFAEMDAAAEALRRDNPDLRDDALADELQILFREIQQRRMQEGLGLTAMREIRERA